ncbi:MAG: propanoyl-CoA acyltransferase [Deltaproteobacteria bacterium HGW-Deltaproteobacteria-19]|jgi:acetyl-CoA C-acetyltransferase|nr:MAG: propanoyl-CoA acyltransferase [Deltaproteobacteria bacterium HGW-Deltaproteobacteria-19]
MEKVAVMGVGQTSFEREKDDTFEEMVFEAVQAALSDAGGKIGDIDNVLTVSNDFWDGRTISSMSVMYAAGAWDKDVSTVEGDGIFGAIYGAMRTLAGSFDTTLVVAHAKGSMGRMNLITNGMFDPIYQRPLGIDATMAAALQARCYMERTGATEEDFASVSVKNHRNGCRNPHVHLGMELSIEDVLRSRKISDPLKLYDCSPISDGAAAVVLANERGAKRFAQKPAWIRGMGHCSDSYTLGYRDLANTRALQAASRKAYGMAGIADPLKELDVVELYDAYSYMELLWYEGLGLAAEGRGAELMMSGATCMGGDLPVNPSGGVLSAHPVLVAGLARLAEAVLQVRGDAGERQVAGAKTALAHGINGACGQAHGVIVIGT